MSYLQWILSCFLRLLCILIVHELTTHYRWRERTLCNKSYHSLKASLTTPHSIPINPKPFYTLQLFIPEFQLDLPPCRERLSIIPDLDLFGVLGDVAVNGFVDLIAFATCYPEDQIVEGCTAEDIHVITCFSVSFLDFAFFRNR
jgi:hypothetical protein